MRSHGGGGGTEEEGMRSYGILKNANRFKVLEPCKSPSVYGENESQVSGAPLGYELCQQPQEPWLSDQFGSFISFFPFHIGMCCFSYIP